MQKPTVKLNFFGKDSNMFGIMRTVNIKLKQEGLDAQAEEFISRATDGKSSYDKVLGLAKEYVKVDL